MNQLETKGRFGTYEKHDSNTGAATNKQLAAVLQYRDRDGTAGTDPKAEWVITEFTAELSLAGTFKFTDGSADISPTWDLGAGEKFQRVGVWIPVGKGKALCYTSSAGNARVAATLVARRYSMARPAGAE